MKENNFKLILIFLIFPFIFSCSINKIAVNKFSQIIDNGMPSIFSEDDLIYAKESIPSNLKLMEIMMETQKNDSLLLNASIGFCGYSFAFLEDENPSRASSFYLKGLNYSDELLKRNGIIKENKIIGEKINKKNAYYLFWNTFCKSGLINLNKDNPDILSKLGEIEEAGELLIKINPEYFYNSIYSLMGSYYASKPKILGGKLEKAFEYFNKAIISSGNDFLINHLLYAKIYGIMAQDEKIFDEQLDFILNYEIKKDEKTLFNKIAIEKAKKLKEKKNDFF